VGHGRVCKDNQLREHDGKGGEFSGCHGGSPVFYSRVSAENPYPPDRRAYVARTEERARRRSRCRWTSLGLEHDAGLFEPVAGSELALRDNGYTLGAVLGDRRDLLWQALRVELPICPTAGHIDAERDVRLPNRNLDAAQRRAIDDECHLQHSRRQPQKPSFVPGGLRDDDSLLAPQYWSLRRPRPESSSEGGS